MEKYTVEDVKYFIKDIIVEKLRKDGKLKRKRPIQYNLSIITDNKKRSKIYILDFSMSLENNMPEPLEFKVTAKKFISKEYDFSSEWQQYLKQQENIKTI